MSTADITTITLPVKDSESNPLLDKAFDALTNEFRPFAELKAEGHTWIAFDTLVLRGLAQERLTSPYDLGTDGRKLHRGTTYEYRRSPLLNG